MGAVFEPDIYDPGSKRLQTWTERGPRTVAVAFLIPLAMKRKRRVSSHIMNLT